MQRSESYRAAAHLKPHVLEDLLLVVPCGRKQPLLSDAVLYKCIVCHASLRLSFQQLAVEPADLLGDLRGLGVLQHVVKVRLHGGKLVVVGRLLGERIDPPLASLSLELTLTLQVDMFFHLVLVHTLPHFDSLRVHGGLLCCLGGRFLRFPPSLSSQPRLLLLLLTLVLGYLCSHKDTSDIIQHTHEEGTARSKQVVT